GLADARLDAPEVVADFDLKVGIDSGERQLLSNPCRIAVDDDAEEQLGADGDDFAAHLLLPTWPSWATHGPEHAARPSTRSGRRRGAQLSASQLYLMGENGAASRILFSCLTVTLPPGGGQMPLSTAFLRTSARWSRLL